MHIVDSLVEKVAGKLRNHENDHEWEAVCDVASRLHKDDRQTNCHPHGAA